MTLKKSRNLKMVFISINTLLLIFSMGALLYLLCRALGGVCYGFLMLISLFIIFLSNTTMQSKLLLTLIIFLIPFGGFAILIWAYLSHNKNCKSSIKVPLWVDYRAFLQKESTFYFDNGKSFFDDLIKEISCAKESVYIFSYIISIGKASQILMCKLFELIDRGMSLNIAVDYYGSGDILKDEGFLALKKRGANIIVKNKPFAFLLLKDNLRTHAKVFIVDKKICYLSSANIDDKSLYEDKNCAVKLVGQNYLNAFYPLWDKPLMAVKDGLTNLPLLAPNKANVEEIFINFINKSKKSVKIVTPYLSVSQNLFTEIKRCVLRGVKVTIIIPALNKSKLDKLSCHFGKKLNRYGVEVFLYDKQFLHSKFLILDDVFAIFGSANFDMRSGRYATESLLLSADNGLIAPLLKDFEHIKSQCAPIQNYKVKESRVVESLFNLFAPLI